MKNNNVIIVGVGVMLLAAGGFLVMSRNAQTPPTNSTPQDENTIVYTSAGFSPKNLTVKAGTAVTFVNESTRPTWPATDVHPTHTEYPNSDISKCGTAEEGSTFDACRNVEPGETYSFTFNEVGEWGFHDHLN